MIVSVSLTTGGAFPFFSSKVQAGFPSPASDYEDRKLDLHEYLIQNPAATFFLQELSGVLKTSKRYKVNEAKDSFRSRFSSVI